MGFKKLSFLQKTILKYSNREGYKDYKFMYKLSLVKVPDLERKSTAVTHFKHSGNAGDIIYAIPAMLALVKEGVAQLHLATGAPGLYKKNFNHPLGNLMLNEKMVSMLKPLLVYQPKIEVCDVYENQHLDYDLDIFRAYPLGVGGHIARWHFLIYAIYPDLSQPWLTAPKDNNFKDTIVISRSFRYRTPGIDYSFLNKYPNKIFLGVAEEYDDMKKMLPDIQYQPVNDFLEMATIINSCRVFIGNQSFPFSVAEGLKSKRLLEVSYAIPNVIVEGNNGYDFCYQPQFEKAFRDMYEKQG